MTREPVARDPTLRPDRQSPRARFHAPAALSIRFQGGSMSLRAGKFSRGFAVRVVIVKFLRVGPIAGTLAQQQQPPPRHRQHRRAALSRAERQPLHGVPGDARGHHHERSDQPRLRAVAQGGVRVAASKCRCVTCSTHIGTGTMRRVAWSSRTRRSSSAIVNMLAALAPPAGNPPLTADAVKMDANRNGLVERSEATGAVARALRALRLQPRQHRQRRGAGARRSRATCTRRPRRSPTGTRSRLAARASR